MADNTLDLNINIGANITDLDGAMTKAQNLLGQFQSALKKATNVGEIQYLNRQIDGLNTTIKNINNQMGNAAKQTGDATQSLVNFSRIAQDAPYGIQGIANNLNPMLESFQRLAQTEGGTKKALTAMIDGLAGPAGLGVVLGLVSSAAVLFSKKISEAFAGPTDKLKTLREELKKLNEDIYKIVGAAQSSQTLGTILVGKVANQDTDINFRKNALRELKKLYADNKEIQDLDVKNINNYNRQYLQSLNNKAAIQLEGIGKEKNYTSALTEANATYKKLIEERDNLIKNTFATTKQIESGKTTEMLRNEIKARYVEPLNKAKADIESAKNSLGRTVDTLLSFNTPDKKESRTSGTDKKEKVSEVQNILKDLQETERSLDYQLSKGMINELPEGKNKKSYYTEKIDAISDAIKKLAGLTSTEAKKALGDLEKELSATKFEAFDKFVNRQGTLAERAIGEKVGDPAQLKRGIKAVEGAGAKNAYEQEQRRIKALDKELKEAQMTAENFANFLASGVTNGLMGMWDAMEQGEDVMESFSNFLKDMVKQLIAMAIQAALVKSIMAAFGGGADGAGGGGLLAGIGKIFGFAEGAVVTQPTLAMIGEGGQGEAVMPLNKLGNMMNSTFNAGAMSGQGSGGTGQFILRGQDLLLSVNRAQKAGNIKGQSISLA
jgi:hypothetical protein